MFDSTALDGLATIGLTAPMRQALALCPPMDDTRPMRVLEVQRAHWLLHDGQATHHARLAGLAAQDLQGQDDAIAVGDWVLARPDDYGSWTIVQRVPAVTQLARRTNDGRGGLKRQVLVSNVDTALLVMGLDHDFNPRRLERYLALAKLARISAVLVLTKSDTLDAAMRERRLATAREALPADVEVLALDARDAQAARALAPWLARGQTLVLLGSSGAGKSTLTNTLTRSMTDSMAREATDPLAHCFSGRLPQSTGAARSDDGRGRHTTTARSLHLTPHGACIIDTPGLRMLRLDVDDAEQLAEVFGDVARWSASCRFRDCRHLQEPGCAVREALPAERLRNYHKLLREAGRDQRSALERQQQVALWKSRGRAAQANMRSKRGQ